MLPMDLEVVDEVRVGRGGNGNDRQDAAEFGANFLAQVEAAGFNEVLAVFAPERVIVSAGDR